MRQFHKYLDTTNENKYYLNRISFNQTENIYTYNNLFLSLFLKKMVRAIIAVILILIGIIVGMYNSLVSMKNVIGNAYADIDVQMKKRFDLVENLVNTVKWYAEHEKGTLEELTNARTKWMNATTPTEKNDANNMLAGALKTLFATSENYPDLKANQNFLDLQKQLTDIEEQIAGSRRYYNATIKDYNTGLEQFPSNIIAKMFGFQQVETYFSITNEAEKEAPKVQF